jgi:hypothetical protein
VIKHEKCQVLVKERGEEKVEVKGGLKGSKKIKLKEIEKQERVGC